LLVTEAGGLMSGLTGEETHMQTGHIIAGTPKVFVELLKAIEPHLTPALKK
jgi:myo-inositol-1(or 4)-monophosphatase